MSRTMCWLNLVEVNGGGGYDVNCLTHCILGKALFRSSSNSFGLQLMDNVFTHIFSSFKSELAFTFKRQ